MTKGEHLKQRKRTKCGHLKQRKRTNKKLRKDNEHSKKKTDKSPQPTFKPSSQFYKYKYIFNKTTKTKEMVLGLCFVFVKVCLDGSFSESYFSKTPFYLKQKIFCFYNWKTVMIPNPPHVETKTIKVEAPNSNYVMRKFQIYNNKWVH